MKLVVGLAGMVCVGGFSSPTTAQNYSGCEYSSILSTSCKQPVAEPFSWTALLGNSTDSYLRTVRRFAKCWGPFPVHTRQVSQIEVFMKSLDGIEEVNYASQRISTVGCYPDPDIESLRDPAITASFLDGRLYNIHRTYHGCSGFTAGCRIGSMEYDARILATVRQPFAYDPARGKTDKAAKEVYASRYAKELADPALAAKLAQAGNCNTVSVDASAPKYSLAYFWPSYRCIVDVDVTENIWRSRSLIDVTRKNDIADVGIYATEQQFSLLEMEKLARQALADEDLRIEADAAAQHETLKSQKKAPMWSTK
ncbi:hypothetical protein [Microvirga antarctica]|uniref:hypothetical protein n=1 Tax=Microvirga antarctica TaxID=2819233 RepID=UPI001B312D2B|nr:hypothetical protein [Microvirga antarctica]